jgi:hypothetical protein
MRLDATAGIDPKQTYCAVTVRTRINANDALFGFWHRSGEQ